MTTLSDAGRALCYLSERLQLAEDDVMSELKFVLAAQENLRSAITTRDALQQTLNLTAKFVARETV